METLTLLEVIKYLTFLASAVVGGLIWLLRIKWQIDVALKRLVALEDTLKAHLEEAETWKRQIVQINEQVRHIGHHLDVAWAARSVDFPGGSGNNASN